MEWQPIETAPKDGTPFLAKGGEQDFYYPEHGEIRPTDVAVIWWDSENDVWRFCTYDSGYYGEWCNPIGWMPIP